MQLQGSTAAPYNGRVPVQVDRVPAGADTDTATARTIKLMAEYIRAAVSDPEVVRCADYAFRRFGAGNASCAAKCWAVFWYVKHCIKFRSDEATLFRLGQHDEHDLILSPSVLVRLKEPSEDCDGFTCLGAAMLSILGVPVYIATVAVDLDNPGRWSHVFPIAVCDGRVVPLDMSHGEKPGWMVPRGRINRFQAWGLDGKPANEITMPAFQGLHGYRRQTAPMVAGPRRFRGMGDWIDDLVGASTSSSSGGGDAGSYLPIGGGIASTPGFYGTVGGSSPSSSSDITGLLTSITQGGMKILGSVLTPPAYQQTTRDAYGNIVSTTVRSGVTPSGAAAIGAGSIGLSPTLLIGLGVGLVALMILSNKGR